MKETRQPIHVLLQFGDCFCSDFHYAINQPPSYLQRLFQGRVFKIQSTDHSEAQSLYKGRPLLSDLHKRVTSETSPFAQIHHIREHITKICLEEPNTTLLMLLFQRLGRLTWDTIRSATTTLEAPKLIRLVQALQPLAQIKCKDVVDQTLQFHLEQCIREGLGDQVDQEYGQTVLWLTEVALSEFPNPKAALCRSIPHPVAANLAFHANWWQESDEQCAILCHLGNRGAPVTKRLQSVLKRANGEDLRAFLWLKERGEFTTFESLQTRPHVLNLPPARDAFIAILEKKFPIAAIVQRPDSFCRLPLDQQQRLLIDVIGKFSNGKTKQINTLIRRLYGRLEEQPRLRESLVAASRKKRLWTPCRPKTAQPTQQARTKKKKKRKAKKRDPFDALPQPTQRNLSLLLYDASPEAATELATRIKANPQDALRQLAKSIGKDYHRSPKECAKVYVAFTRLLSLGVEENRILVFVSRHLKTRKVRSTPELHAAAYPLCLAIARSCPSSRQEKPAFDAMFNLWTKQLSKSATPEQFYDIWELIFKSPFATPKALKLATRIEGRPDEKGFVRRKKLLLLRMFNRAGGLALARSYEVLKKADFPFHDDSYYQAASKVLFNIASSKLPDLYENLFIELAENILSHPHITPPVHHVRTTIAIRKLAANPHPASTRLGLALLRLSQPTLGKKNLLPLTETLFQSIQVDQANEYLISQACQLLWYRIVTLEERHPSPASIAQGKRLIHAVGKLGNVRIVTELVNFLQRLNEPQLTLHPLLDQLPPADARHLVIGTILGRQIGQSDPDLQPIHPEAYAWYTEPDATITSTRENQIVCFAAAASYAVEANATGTPPAKLALSMIEPNAQLLQTTFPDTHKGAPFLEICQRLDAQLALLNIKVGQITKAQEYLHTLYHHSQHATYATNAEFLIAITKQIALHHANGEPFKLLPLILQADRAGLFARHTDQMADVIIKILQSLHARPPVEEDSVIQTLPALYAFAVSKPVLRRSQIRQLFQHWRTHFDSQPPEAVRTRLSAVIAKLATAAIEPDVGPIGVVHIGTAEELTDLAIDSNIFPPKQLQSFISGWLKTIQSGSPNDDVLTVYKRLTQKYAKIG